MADAAERCLDIVAQLGAELKDQSLILAPVWGGESEAEEHCTLLIVRKAEGKWQVEYKDSLTNEHASCRDNAQKISTVLSAALMVDLKFPEKRKNLSLQPKGSLEC